MQCLSDCPAGNYQINVGVTIYPDTFCFQCEFIIRNTSTCVTLASCTYMNITTGVDGVWFCEDWTEDIGLHCPFIVAYYPWDSQIN